MKYSELFTILLTVAIFVNNVSAQIYFRFPGNFRTNQTEWIAGPEASVYNNTDSRWEVSGWRFYTESIGWDNFIGDVNAYSKTEQTSNGILHEVRFSRPDLFLVRPNGTTAITPYGVGYNGKTVQAGTDGTPRDKRVLMKLYDKGVPLELPEGAEPISPSDIPALIASNPNYYNPDHRFLDTLGMRGGPFSGGFLDTWGDETQFQLPVTGDTFSLSNTDVYFMPEISRGPIYWMSFAMLQEYFSADIQYQMAIGFKETMAGLGSTNPQDPYVDGNKMNNRDGAFGPFEIETYTYVTQAMYYPDFFPRYKTQLSREASEHSFNTNVMTTTNFTSYYCGPLDGTLLNNPQVIGCMIASHLVLRRIYDILANAQRICFKEIMERGKDRRIAVAALGVMYNRGITAPDQGTNITVDSVFDIDKFERFLDDPDAQRFLPVGNSLYREHMLQLCEEITSWSKRAYEDKSIRIYDTFITLDELRLFFFGTGGTVNSQGSGGLLNHFTVDRQAFWRDLNDAFGILSAHWDRPTPAISLRYDWLTMLRAVKKHFPIKMALRPASTEAAIWMRNRSLDEGDCGCDGTPVDRTAPFKRLLGSRRETGFTAQFHCTDNQAVRELIWTADRKWNVWHEGELIRGNRQDGVWQLVAAEAQLNNRDTIWVGAVDSSGNAEISAIAVRDSGSVSVSHDLSLRTTAFAPIVALRDGALYVTGVEGALTLRILDLRGRTVFTSQATSRANSAVFQLPLTASGIYVGEITDSQGREKKRVRIAW